MTKMPCEKHVPVIVDLKGTVACMRCGKVLR